MLFVTTLYILLYSAFEDAFMYVYIQCFGITLWFVDMQPNKDGSKPLGFQLKTACSKADKMMEEVEHCQKCLELEKAMTNVAANINISAETKADDPAWFKGN